MQVLIIIIIIHTELNVLYQGNLGPIVPTLRSCRKRHHRCVNGNCWLGWHWWSPNHPNCVPNKDWYLVWFWLGCLKLEAQNPLLLRTPRPACATPAAMSNPISLAMAAARSVHDIQSCSSGLSMGKWGSLSLICLYIHFKVAWDRLGRPKTPPPMS